MYYEVNHSEMLITILNANVLYFIIPIEDVVSFLMPQQLMTLEIPFLNEVAVVT